MKRNKNGQFRSTKHLKWIGVAWLIFLIALIVINSRMTVTYEYVSPLVEAKASEVEDFKMSYKVKEKDSENPTWQEVVSIIVEEFDDLGTEVTMQALKIAKCESGFRYDAYNDGNLNGSNDGGVFQINSIHKQSDEVRFTARQNIRWAKEKYERDGNWNAWSCKKIL